MTFLNLLCPRPNFNSERNIRGRRLPTLNLYAIFHKARIPIRVDYCHPTPIASEEFHGTPFYKALIYSSVIR